ncbi:Hypothetical predicted protein, partial [Pelobates cultripes]
ALPQGLATTPIAKHISEIETRASPTQTISQHTETISHNNRLERDPDPKSKYRYAGESLLGLLPVTKHEPMTTTTSAWQCIPNNANLDLRVRIK